MCRTWIIERKVCCRKCRKINHQKIWLKLHLSLLQLLIFIPTLIDRFFDQTRLCQTRNRVQCLCDCKWVKYLTLLNHASNHVNWTPPSLYYYWYMYVRRLFPFFLYLCYRSILEVYIPPHKSESLSSMLWRNPTLTMLFVRTIDLYLIFLSFLKFSNVLSSSNFFLIFNSLLPSHHYCGFRINHSTETARLYLLSGIYSAINKSQLSAPGPFDVSAAFNMVDPQILRERPESSWKLFLHQEPPFPLALILPIWPNPYHYPATVVHPGFQSIWAFPRTLL